VDRWWADDLERQSVLQIPATKVEKAGNRLVAGKAVRTVARLAGISAAAVSRIKSGTCAMLIIVIIFLGQAFPILARFVGWMLSSFFWLVVVVIAFAVISH
jgi:hypothetical protein